MRMRVVGHERDSFIVIGERFVETIEIEQDVAAITPSVGVIGDHLECRVAMSQRFIALPLPAQQDAQIAVRQGGTWIGRQRLLISRDRRRLIAELALYPSKID